MKRHLATAWLVVLTVGLCSCQSRRDVLTATYPEDQARIRQFLESLRDAIRKKDPARVEAMHLYGPKFTKFDESAGRLDAAAARELERRMVLGKAEMDVNFQDVKVDVFGGVAVTTGVLPRQIGRPVGVRPGSHDPRPGASRKRLEDRPRTLQPLLRDLRAWEFRTARCSRC